MNRNKLACGCREVTYGMIEDAVRAGAKSYEEVQEKLRFGRGCGRCREFIRAFVRELLEEQKESRM